jgi:inositol monophosphatase 3
LRVVVSKSHKSSDEVETAASWAAAQCSAQGGAAIKADLIPVGGAGYKAIEVLEGRAHVYGHASTIMMWDTCAGEALINAAGGQWSTWSGHDTDYCIYETSPSIDSFRMDGVLAAADGDVHALMLQGSQQ